ncbi:MAG TPA: Na+-transporting oxaloacetate decarboxylase subunit gamma [Epsilonproteobacteria bacterium]|nr:Na+-transporting oxaloacetate decarboxylase subunit gamma [Campylobacterota bacterium]
METEVNLIAESIKFMVLGMGVVFLFLWILVQVVKIQAKIIGKYFPDQEPQVSPPAAKQDQDESARVAAIIAAVTEFRKNKS